MRLLFVGDVVGRSGRSVLLEQLPILRVALAARFRRRQRRERGRRLRHHRGDRRGVHRRRRRRHHARQPRLRPARGARLYRAPATADPPGQFPAAARRGAAPISSRRRTAPRVLVVNMMGRVFMDALDDPFAANRRGALRLPAWPSLRRRDRRLPRRGDERETGVRSFRRRARRASSSARIPIRPAPIIASSPAAPPICRTPA